MSFLSWGDEPSRVVDPRSGMAYLLRRDTTWNGVEYSVEVDITTPGIANVYLYQWKLPEKEPEAGQWCFIGPHMFIHTSLDPKLTEAEWTEIIEAMERRILTDSEQLLASCEKFFG